MRRDEAYLLDILIAARKASAFVEGMTWEAFVESELHQNAIIRLLEVLGEAAAHVSQPTREAHPEIPWAEMVGMRHRLIHEYFRVDLRVVWETVRRDLPDLIVLIEPLVPPEEQV
ncbi:MAG: DUF86 domain-containing protein [Anaerolineae bacterium]